VAARNPSFSSDAAWKEPEIMMVSLLAKVVPGCYNQGPGATARIHVQESLASWRRREDGKSDFFLPSDFPYDLSRSQVIPPRRRWHSMGSLVFFQGGRSQLSKLWLSALTS
jgi:hypothetical protein